MLEIGKDIRSLTEFQQETTKFRKQLRAAGKTILLTVNGEAELAVMSAATFQQALAAIDELDMVRGVSEGLQQARDGAGMPSRKFFAGLRKKHMRRRTNALGTLDL